MAAAAVIDWPSPRYREDPVGFAEDILGIEPWDRQIEILEAIRDHKRVAVSSGHKVGKSNTAAIAALWFFSSFDDARVVMTCVTSRQVDEILYREVKKLHHQAGHCVACAKESAERVKRDEAPLPKPCEHSALLDGVPAGLARSGIHADAPGDQREIVGFTAKEAEAVAGISGKNLLYLVDEASGVPQEIYDAIEGNRAGGARLLMTGNPTQCEGEHFEAFESKSKFYVTIRVSSEESPNVVEGREVIEGLATRDWVDEKKEEWGVESALYKVRVLGQHAKNETGRIFSLRLLEDAEGRWSSTLAEGRLFIGLDPAGPGEGGDETTMTARRGQKQLELLALGELTADAVVVNLVGFIGKHRRGRERCPVVVVDRTGPLGDKVVKKLFEYLEDHPDAFYIVSVWSNVPAKRQPHLYTTVRDELLANLETWMREGGAILADAKQSKELNAPAWHAAAPYGKKASLLKATDKKLIRKAIGRSPDRADSLALSVWEPPSLQIEDAPPSPAASGFDPRAHDVAVSTERRAPSPYNSPMYGRRR